MTFNEAMAYALMAMYVRVQTVDQQCRPAKNHLSHAGPGALCSPLRRALILAIKSKICVFRPPRRETADPQIHPSVFFFFFATFYLPCLAKEVKCRLNCLRPDAAVWPKGPRATNATAHHRVIKKGKMLQKMDLPHFF